ncbi:MAG: PaaI family thioesterase [Proteobacteria bacterium]|nr:PaaI family thioesterase [Pseudomonadota bacterium]
MIPTVLDQFDTPNCAKLLGLDILEADPPRGWVRIAFEGKPEFCNASGTIQGGFLSAMLDDTMGPAVLIHTNAERLPSTIDLHVTFLAPARPGKLFGEGLVTQIGKTIGFAEARLVDEDGRVLARATSSFRVRRLADALA